MTADQPTLERPPAEPATSRALWPTFLRRTLAEDSLVVGPITPRPTAPTASATPPPALRSGGK